MAVGPIAAGISWHHLIPHFGGPWAGTGPGGLEGSWKRNSRLGLHLVRGFGPGHRAFGRALQHTAGAAVANRRDLGQSGRRELPGRQSLGHGTATGSHHGNEPMKGSIFYMP